MDSQIGAFRKRYPVLSRILIDTREEYMINRLKRVMDSTTGQVLAVVGFGHELRWRGRLQAYMEETGRSQQASPGRCQPEAEVEGVPGHEGRTA